MMLLEGGGQRRNRGTEWMSLELSLGDWILEFACDWFATFAAGPSFAWANLRLCARMSTDLFRIHAHPADAARTQAIVELLKLVAGDASRRSRLRTNGKSCWERLQRKNPSIFGIPYPPDLIRELAAEASQLFRNSGFHSYNPGSKPLGDLLTEGWNYFQTNPSGFPRVGTRTIAATTNFCGHLAY